MCAAYSEMDSQQEALLASRDMVIPYQTIAFPVAANGRKGTLPVAEMFRLRDGKVVEWRALCSYPCLVARALAGED